MKYLIKNQWDFDALELGIVQAERYKFIFLLLHVDIYVYQQSLFKLLLFSCVCFDISVEYYFITWMHLYVLMFGSSILLQCNAGLIYSSNKFYYDSCNLSWYLKQFPHHCLFFSRLFWLFKVFYHPIWILE